MTRNIVRAIWRCAAAVLAVATIVAAPAVTGSALADEPAATGSGHLTAAANGPTPTRGAAIALEVPDRAISSRPDMYEAARGVLEKFATARGLALASTAPLVMRLRIDSTAYDGDRSPPPPDASSAMARLDIVNQVHLPLDSSLADGAAAYIVHLDLYRPGEPPLWTATVQADARTASPEQLIGRMTEALIEVFGMSADRDFTLACDRTAQPGALCL